MRCLSQGGSWIINWEHFERFTLEWERPKTSWGQPEKLGGDFLSQASQ